MQDNGNSHACLWKSLTNVWHVVLATHVCEYTSDMYYVLILSPWLAQLTQTQTYFLRHYKNAYSDEKESKKTEGESGKETKENRKSIN